MYLSEDIQYLGHCFSPTTFEYSIPEQIIVFVRGELINICLTTDEDQYYL